MLLGVLLSALDVADGVGVSAAFALIVPARTAPARSPPATSAGALPYRFHMPLVVLMVERPHFCGPEWAAQNEVAVGTWVLPVLSM